MSLREQVKALATGRTCDDITAELGARRKSVYEALDLCRRRGEIFAVGQPRSKRWYSDEQQAKADEPGLIAAAKEATRARIAANSRKYEQDRTAIRRQQQGEPPPTLRDQWRAFIKQRARATSLEAAEAFGVTRQRASQAAHYLVLRGEMFDAVQGHRTVTYFATKAAADAFVAGHRVAPPKPAHGPAISISRPSSSAGPAFRAMEAYIPPGVKFTRCPAFRDDRFVAAEDFHGPLVGEWRELRGNQPASR